jgi:hypothetical protein
MKRNILGVLAFALVLFVVQGCSTAGLLPSAHVTQVQLAQPNYKIVATGVSGSAKVANAFGLSIGIGLGSISQGVIPIADKRLKAEYKVLKVKADASQDDKDRLVQLKNMRFNAYQAALDDLWRNFEAKHGKASGRSLALANIRFDSRNLNLLVYSQSVLTLTADVVEFK